MQGQGSGREGGEKPGFKGLLGCVLHYPTSRAILSHIGMDQVEDWPYSSKPLFAKIVSFLKEEREEGMEKNSAKNDS